jgi:hypothetical protein
MPIPSLHTEGLPSLQGKAVGMQFPIQIKAPSGTSPDEARVVLILNELNEPSLSFFFLALHLASALSFICPGFGLRSFFWLLLISALYFHDFKRPDIILAFALFINWIWLDGILL